MAIRKREYGKENETVVYKLPEYNKRSKMNQYDVFFDPKLNNKPNLGFFRGLYFTEDQLKGMMKFIVTGEFEGRIDLISFKFYGTTENDWVIENINDIEDPIKDIVAGKQLLIPSEVDLYNIFG